MGPLTGKILNSILVDPNPCFQLLNVYFCSGNSASETQTSIAENKIPGLSPKNSSKKKKKEKDGAASSDEERWLNAIESGKLEEV